MSVVEIPPSRWDPETYRPPSCPQCGDTVDIDCGQWQIDQQDITTLGRDTP